MVNRRVRVIRRSMPAQAHAFQIVHRYAALDQTRTGRAREAGTYQRWWPQLHWPATPGAPSSVVAALRAGRFLPRRVRRTTPRLINNYPLSARSVWFFGFEAPPRGFCRPKWPLDVVVERPARRSVLLATQRDELLRIHAMAAGALPTRHLHRLSTYGAVHRDMATFGWRAARLLAHVGLMEHDDSAHHDRHDPERNDQRHLLRMPDTSGARKRHFRAPSYQNGRRSSESDRRANAGYSAVKRWWRGPVRRSLLVLARGRRAIRRPGCRTRSG